MPGRRPRTLSAQALVMQLLIVIVTLGVVAAAGFLHARDTLHDQYGQRSLAVARTVANLPDTLRALAAGAPGGELQAIVERIRVETGMTYIAVADANGIRYTHPNEDRIGEMLSTDPSAALAGETTITTETGTLGTTVRAKVPVLDDDATIIGLVSVGVSTDEIGEQTMTTLWTILGYGSAALLLGVLGSWVLARRLRRKTFGLAPSEIATLYEHREAMLLSIREGVVTLDARGRITLINDEARRLLHVGADSVGMSLRDLVPSPHLAAVLDGGHDGTHDDADTSVVSHGRVLVVSRRPVTVRSNEIGAVVTLRDRTELQDLVSELASVKGMADSLRAKAHEYSNRMHTIAGLLELGHIDEAVRYVTHESRFAQSLTEAYAEELGDPTLVALLLSKSAVASERGIELRIVRDDTMLTAHLAHSHDTVTAVGNLIDNAFDAAAGRGADGGWVEVDLRASGRSLVVSVSDSGPGVEPSDREHIFEYGYTTKPMSNPTGDRASANSERGGRGVGGGIGLALVAETAERHGGSVELLTDGPVGSGATFRVTLADMLDAGPEDARHLVAP